MTIYDTVRPKQAPTSQSLIDETATRAACQCVAFRLRNRFHD
jgi:hypothetical protein